MFPIVVLRVYSNIENRPMKLSAVKEALKGSTAIQFALPDGTLVPSHFHVTEVGKVTRHFIDCGGTERQDSVVNFQLWEADDYDHRLHPEKLVHIINLSESRLGINDDLPVEVEYQGSTIGRYDLAHMGEGKFVLVSKKTDCLAKDNCGIPEAKPKMNISEIDVDGNSCDEGAGCC